MLTADDVRGIVTELGDLAAVIEDADPKLKAKVYADLGIRLVYRPADRVLAVEAAPACATARVGGGT